MGTRLSSLKEYAPIRSTLLEKALSQGFENAAWIYELYKDIGVPVSWEVISEGCNGDINYLLFKLIDACECRGYVKELVVAANSTMRLNLSPVIRYVGRLAYTPEDFSSYFLNGKDIQLTLEKYGPEMVKAFSPLATQSSMHSFFARIVSEHNLGSLSSISGVTKFANDIANLQA
jgi:hypothetical protein